MKVVGKNGEYFEVVDITADNCHTLKSSGNSELSLLWSDSDNNRIRVDSKEYVFNKNDIICLTEFHRIEVLEIHQLRLLRFNRPFYCILDHDSEVGCKGILYYGASSLPVIQPTSEELDILLTVRKMLCIEMASQDNLQMEMLQMMLKRLLILCTRIHKSSINYQKLETDNMDLIREFNFLVEQHFKEKHHVNDYALLLNKAPKTLSNLFKKIGGKTPRMYIHDRIHLEAQRLLRYSEKNISEIGYELGFSEVQTFSRFFKKQEGLSPVDYRSIQR